ncbi:MAG: signal peptidase I [Clostridiaceae bacterium]|nr:signal peptidase I [Clostridiaceae bacterium]
MEKNNNDKTSAGEELFGWAQSLIWALIFLVLVSSFLVRISGVLGNSMYPTLKNGDRVLVQLMGYDEAQNGDIVVIMASQFDDEPLVKRVIAVAGDVIEIGGEGEVYINGEKLYEPYINEQYFSQGSLDAPYTVPEGHVFVMGDNRNHSADSRLEEIGALNTDDIIGKVFFRLWPVGSFGGI